MMLKKRFLSFSFPRLLRALCSSLLIFSTILSILDVLCFLNYMALTYQKHAGRGKLEHSCFGLKHSLDRIKTIAIDLDDAMRRRLTTMPTMAKERKESKERRSKGVVRHNVMLMAYKRSGSSFVGQIFNQHPGVFYLYEPIYYLKALEHQHNGIYRILFRHLLQIIFTCKFQGNPYFVSQLSDSAFRQYSRTLSEGEWKCSNTSDSTLNTDSKSCKRLDVKSLIDICQSHQHSVLKTIRIENLDEVRNAAEQIQDPLGTLKIAHLVRDPRAIISSRAHVSRVFHKKVWKSEDYSSNSKTLCTKMLKDIHSGTSRDYNGMYNVIRYEDIITDTTRAVNDLFNFTGLPKNDLVFKWLGKNSKTGHNEYAFSTNRNKTVAMTRWRKQNKLSIIRIIEKECSTVMSLLGYIGVKDGVHLLDISKPLFITNNGPTTFLTQTVRKRLEKTL